MNFKLLNSVWILIFLQFPRNSNNSKQERFPISRGFLVYRTVSITQNSCSCATSYSCSCCRKVIILYTKAEKNLCVNFTYQRNGFNIDVSLDSNIVKAKIVTDYKPIQFCVHIPGCLFSKACVNVVELNQFPRSITACLRLDIFSKKQLWQINYDCVSISTELPTLPANVTMQMMVTATMPSSESGTITEKSAGTMTMSTQTTKMTTLPTVMSKEQTMTTMMMTMKMETKKMVEPMPKDMTMVAKPTVEMATETMSSKMTDAVTTMVNETKDNMRNMSVTSTSPGSTMKDSGEKLTSMPPMDVEEI